MKAIEKEFPFEQIDSVAEAESWRKEVNRPIYHIHKWWANRLGSVFRTSVLGSVLDAREEIWPNFYKTHSFSSAVVLDPFMGSGTTLGEAVKLGVKAIGCDINPISSFIVKQALSRVDLQELNHEFEALRSGVQGRIQNFYRTIDPVSGSQCDALYYFWVKVVTTPAGEEVPLFSDYVFSKDAYPSKKPKAQILCPKCWAVNIGRFDATEFTCPSCQKTFDPQTGPVDGQYLTDSTGARHKVKELVNSSPLPPKHRMYAIMAISSSGEKIYIQPTKFDFELYEQASKELLAADLPLPDMPVREGHNTNQARSYGYKNWRQFFNDRQLLGLGLLLKAILEIRSEPVREHFLCLFSGTLEFNNLFCSFKGEGTGAVRHMFSNHILKPERTPLENSIWGTTRSSGTFSTLYESRLLRAKGYLDQPFELQVNEVDGKQVNEKIVCSNAIRVNVVDNYEAFAKAQDSVLVLNGDSACLPVPDKSVDAVVTDPPYFDFVHYSELSDFFYAWLAPALGKRYPYFKKTNCKDANEVQHKEPAEFGRLLGRVFQECHRVLKDDGLLVFSFHHSAPEAWAAIYQAIVGAGFSIVAAHPVKAEMAGGSPKSAASDPINLDAMLVCKKHRVPTTVNRTSIVSAFLAYVKRFEQAGRTLGLNDKRVILASQALVSASAHKLPLSELVAWLGEIFKWGGAPNELPADRGAEPKELAAA